MVDHGSSTAQRLDDTIHVEGVVLRTAAAQIRGNRDEQEDAYAIVQLSNALLVAVADGVGGGPIGEVASNRAIVHLVRTLQGLPPQTVEAWSGALDMALQNAHAAVCQLGEPYGHGKRPASTLVAAIILPSTGRLVYRSVGDSHLYVMSDGQLRHLNTLHSAPGDRITNALGWRIEEMDGARIPNRISSRDTILLSSDGLDTLSETAIAEILASEADPSEAIGRLLDRVTGERRIDQDNCTLVLVASAATAEEAGGNSA